MNNLADVSHNEYRVLLGYRPDIKNKSLLKDSPFKNKRDGFMYAEEVVSDLPKEIDWRDLNAVSAVKN